MMTIEDRLENMERELGRVKEVLARSQVKGTAKEIRANSFVLEDENGKPRAGLHMTKYGPSLALNDEKGVARAALNMAKYGPGLMLFGPDGKVIWSAIK